MLTGTQAREVVHLLLLERLVALHDGRAVTLKGGVNLRMFFGSPRYSEDIDLDGARDRSAAIRGSIKAAFDDREFRGVLRRLGIRGLDPGEGPNKDTRTTFRYKFGVFVPGQIRYPTKIEVSFRDSHPGDPVAVAEPGREITRRYGVAADLDVPHYDRPAAVRQKIEALGGRRTVQARDLFDLDHLLRPEVPATLESFLSEGLGARLLKTAYDRALEITYEEYEGQVLEFLEPEIRSEYERPSLWDEMRLRVADLIARVRAARGEP